MDLQVNLEYLRDPPSSERYEVDGKRKLFERLFDSVKLESLRESESLQGFAKSFGYSVTVEWRSLSSGVSVLVNFKRAV